MATKIWLKQENSLNIGTNQKVAFQTQRKPPKIEKFIKKCLPHEQVLKLNRIWNEYFTELYNKIYSSADASLALLQAEFIGAQIEIIGAQNTSFVGLKGIIINETKNMLLLQTSSRLIKIPKNEALIKFYTDNHSNYIINCKNLVKKRTKRLVNKILINNNIIL